MEKVLCQREPGFVVTPKGQGLRGDHGDRRSRVGAESTGGRACQACDVIIADGGSDPTAVVDAWGKVRVVERCAPRTRRFVPTSRMLRRGRAHRGIGLSPKASRERLSFTLDIKKAVFEKSEAKADDLIRWTEARALVATGSPFAPVSYGGRRIPITQCNNVHLSSHGTWISRVRCFASIRCDDAGGGRALAGNSPDLKDSSASLLPPLTDIRRVAAEIAIAVGMEAQKDGIAPKLAEDELRRRVIAAQWTPAYASFAGTKKLKHFRTRSLLCRVLRVCRSKHTQLHLHERARWFT